MAWSLKSLFPRKAGSTNDSNSEAIRGSASAAGVAATTDTDAGTSAEAWFQRGNTYVAAQQWQSALDCYRKATDSDLGHAAAHTFEGNVLLQLGQREEAVAAYARAIAANGTLIEPHYNRGLVLLQLQQPLLALDSFQTALDLNPGLAAGHCGKADALSALGRPADALAAYEAALAADSGYLNAYLRKGMLEQQLQNWQAAQHSYRRALSVNPQHAESHFRLGTLHRDIREWTAALSSFGLAIGIEPGHVSAHAERGAALISTGKTSEAIAAFDTVLRLQPGHARVVSARAQAYAKLGLRAQARADHDQAALLATDDPEIHFNRGSFLSDESNWAQALRSLQRAAALRPDYAEAHANMGFVLQETGQIEAAVECYSRALEIDPRLSVALNNRGNIRRTRKQLVEAMQDYRDALALDPKSADAHYNLGQLALLQGDFATGWPEYEWRTSIKEATAALPREFVFPLWRGEPLQGKSIFVYAEQGLGDTIQFCRYVSILAELGARVSLEVQKPLRDLLAHLKGVSHLMTPGETVPVCDFQCSLMSLPGAFNTSLRSIPAHRAYLHADPLMLTRWQTALGPRVRPRIGLAWSGNPRHSNDAQRSLPLAQWAPQLPDGFDYICVQNQIQDADREALRARGIQVFNADMHETAALMMSLDLVISVDTSLAHLSGALGLKTWILLAFLPDWRWLLDRDDTPWYPTATLYRQRNAGDWSDVLADVKKSLLQMLH